MEPMHVYIGLLGLLEIIRHGTIGDHKGLRLERYGEKP